MAPGGGDQVETLVTTVAVVPRVCTDRVAVLPLLRVGVTLAFLVGIGNGRRLFTSGDPSRPKTTLRSARRR